MQVISSIEPMLPQRYALEPVSKGSGELVGLDPRERGPLKRLEKSYLYQGVARKCVDQSPDPYSLHGMLCSVLVDFGIK